MSKKAVIVIHLVDESAETPNEEIEQDIHRELSQGFFRVPWCNRVEKVTVKET